jgi:dynein heavy chain
MSPGPSNELFKLDMSSDSAYYWTKIRPTERNCGQPCARWQHSAVLFDACKIIVFGGFATSKEKPHLSDVWVLDTAEDTWLSMSDLIGSLSPEKSSIDIKPSWKDKFVKVDHPCSRGSHSSVLVGSFMFVFGGYGGEGFARRDFNDLHALCLKTWTWYEIETRGKKPKPRSGHKSVYFDGKLYVMGGWNSVETFDDVHILDTETLTWSKPNNASGADAWGPKRWNLSAVAVFAVPFWKIFVFGGKSGDLDQNNPQGAYLNDVQVLETIHVDNISCHPSMSWVQPNASGEKPSPRSEADMFYSPSTGKLSIFGGWSNVWHGDLYSCDVSTVVGPTYNIFSIESKEWKKPIGPVTGNTEIVLLGKGFSSASSTNATIRLACAKGYIDVTGAVVDDTTISFFTPNFQKHGAVKVQIRLKIGCQSFTNDSVEFSFFSVTCCKETVAFGPGLMNSNLVNNETLFLIQGKDRLGRDRICGMDKYEVNITHLASKSVIPCRIQDNNDGTYLVRYTPDICGEMIVDIKFSGTFNGNKGSIRGSPFRSKAVSLQEGDFSDSNLNGIAVQNFIEKAIQHWNESLLSTEKGINLKVSAEDLKSLLSVKEHLRKISSISDSFETSIATIRSYLQYLIRTKLKFPSTDTRLKQLELISKRWVDIKEIVPYTTERIASVNSIWASKTKFKIEAYSRDLQEKERVFRQKDFWSCVGQNGDQISVEEIEKSFHDAKLELARETKLLEENAYLCNMFHLEEFITLSRDLLINMKRDIEAMEYVWKMHANLDECISRVKNLPWNLVKIDALEDEAKTQIGAVKLADKRIHWSEAFRSLDKKSKVFLATVPLISLLMSKSMRRRHWSALMNVSRRMDFVLPLDNPSILLGSLLDMNLYTLSHHIEEICDQAIKEEKIETSLAQIESRWSKIEFKMSPYANHMNVNEEIPLLSIEEEDFESLESDQLVIQTMLASRYVSEFETEAKYWQKALFNINEVILMITEIQRIWSFLEPLFIHSEEVKRELPEDSARFFAIDKNVQAALRTAWSITNVKSACNQEGLIENLEFVQEQLDMCSKSLTDFLDSRRREFPRYYFVSEADLLDILSNGGNPKKILVHISKVYLATKTLVLDENTCSESGRPLAIEFVSGVGSEVCKFEPPVKLDGKVEIYMQTILDGQKQSIFETVKRSMVRYQSQSRADWVLAKDGPSGASLDPAQTCLLVLAINYVSEVENAFIDMSNGSQNAMVEYSKKQVNQLSDLIQLTQSDLSKGERTKVMVCITMDAHSRDIVEKIIRSNVDSAESFMWQSQLKHKYRIPPSYARHQNRDPGLRGENQERVEIAICDAILPYDYEYLGNGPRLVITPLTDRVYVTATQALNLNMGCAPAGPAGTGKTETTKDLANALAKLIYVINCSPEMDYKGLGNIFKGVASSGAWVCFDEFNRLIPEVLSVCTVQFKAVCDGISSSSPRIRVEGDEISLDPTCGAFITMNPGYLGRSELPEGLKALFRPMTVMVPDLILICENMLMAEGFVTAKSLASKFFCLYALLKSLLSAQLHYDWGLRAIKSVLVVAGGFKRAEPNLPEDALLMRALRDFNIPKIVREDEVIFYGLLGDLFPGLDPPRKIDESLERYVLDACKMLGNDPDETFRLKVVQLEELLAIRHCIFIMGPAGSGKSQCLRTLKEARDLREPSMITRVVDLNPKAVKTDELYGYISMATREWKDGLLSNIMRNLSSIPDDKPKWIHLDGDLDANWIESMNSVMDDNRMLTLASNERIPLLPHMRMIFEIRDLKHATPATVSRAGILYISTDEGYQWKSLINSWISKKVDWDEANQSIMRELFDNYISKALLWIMTNVNSIVPVEDTSRVQILLNMLDGCLNDQILENINSIENVFVYCAIWALGSSLCTSDDGTDHRKCFSEWWRQEFGRVKFPSRDTVFDYWLDLATMNFEPWIKSPHFYSVNFDSNTISMSQVTIPTPETSSVAHWINLLVTMGKPVMMAGPAGTGKTQLMKGILGNLNHENYQTYAINFNFYTTASVLSNSMSIPLEKKTGTNYGPIGNTKLIYFIDDLNLPEVDIYNTQSAIAHLRQHMEYEHCYDLQKMSLKNITNTQVVTCMNPTAGSFVVNPRLQRWFATFAMSLPGSTSLLTIYQTFLDGHLADFSQEIKDISNHLIKAALGLHASVSSSFKKTATNFYYEFNIRHISNIFQGLLMSKSSSFTSAEKFILLWLHESERVYGDRLASTDDFSKYNTLVQMHCKKISPSFPIAKYYAKENAEPLLFCHFSENLDNPVYDQVTCLHTLNKVLDFALQEYNETNATMDLVLFEDAMKHVARIVRIIRNEGGHALLLGVGGSGKQSLARLSAFICGFSLEQIVVGDSYSINDFKDDLKLIYNKAGIKGDGVLFLMTDAHISNERFLVYINDLLASGNIPNLFTPDEVDSICNTLSKKVKVTGVNPDKKNCWAFFLAQIRKNLHVCFCFSPVGEAFRDRAMKFPALINCSVIDIFKPWPKDALYSVGKKFLRDIDLGNNLHRDVVERFLPFSFEEVNKMSLTFKLKEKRHVYTTPKSYLEFIKLYKRLLHEKRNDADFAIQRLEKGLKKLKETTESVSKLEDTLKSMLEDAAIKKEKSEEIAAKVAKEKALVEAETARAQVERNEVKRIADEVFMKQKDTEQDLAKAEPAVEAAMQALDTLDQKDLSSCKGMLKPPPKLDEVFAATMCLLAGIMPTVIVNKAGKVKDTSWDAAKKQLMGNIKDYMTHLKDIKRFVDEGTINPNNFKEVRHYIEQDYFNVDTMRTKNQAAAGLCSFVLNIVTYYDIVVTVEPKRQALSDANSQLLEANKKLEAVMAHVANLEEKLAKLNQELDVANKSKQDALEAVTKGERKLNLAQRLINALSSENDRWAENILILRNNAKLLTGDVLIASAFVAYAGPFTKPFRNILMDEVFLPFLKSEFIKACDGEVADIPMNQHANFLNVLTTDAEIAQWNADFLPADIVSTENAAVVCNTFRWPLLIDPQLQGIRWLKRKEGGADRCMKIVRLGQKDWIRNLERAVENGHTLIIENLGENIDALLNPIIQRATFKRGTRHFIKVGDKECDFHPDFRLYLHTKLSNPHYPPEIQAETTIINFTVTVAGLEDQLLSLVVQKERPDLASLNDELIRKQNEFTIRMKQLEDSILLKLTSATGDITEDVALIESLEETKVMSEDIEQQSQLAKQTQMSIFKASEIYRPVASRSSLLFFLMNDLAKIHTYYIYSLEAFQRVFFRGIQAVTSSKTQDSDTFSESPTEEVLVKRCVQLKESITFTVFNYIRRGLFDKDKLTVAVLLTLNILTIEGQLDPNEIQYLLQDNLALDPGDIGILESWLPQHIWPKIKGLESLDNFQGLGDDMQSETDEWSEWYNSDSPELLSLPGEYDKNLSTMQKLILLRVMRPDRLLKCLRDFVSNTIGSEYVTERPFNLRSTFDEMNNQTPVFFTLFAGVDPTPWVEDLGRDFDKTIENKKFVNISMGQGQEGPAEVILRRSAKEGSWVMLQNCHLMTSWVPKLENLLEHISQNAHEDFRCFISAEPPPLPSWKNMPESLMRNCIKVSNQAPTDIKSNLIRSWDNFSQETFEFCKKPREMKACLFSLCWFHAIVCGRRQFGQQGWSRNYSFNNGDLMICSDILRSYLDFNNSIPWEDLRYIFGEIMYGGHITDAWDRRVCKSYLEVYQQEELFRGCELAPGFNSPSPDEMTYDNYVNYIETSMPDESPLMFGLHPNTEIRYLTNYAENVLLDVLSIKGGHSSSSNTGNVEDPVRETIRSLLDRLPSEFEMVDIGMRAKAFLSGVSGPYVVVAIQECRRMNILLEQIKQSLSDLEKGLNGLLNMSADMENLARDLSLNQWPKSWENIPSQKNLMSQFFDISLRVEQLCNWIESFDVPKSIWLGGLFSPMSYITAALQVTARQRGLALDKMTIETHVTNMRDLSEITEPATDGCYVHGLFLEGASIGSSGFLCENQSRDSFFKLPVVYLKAVPVLSSWEPTSVGYMRNDESIYEVPCYSTTFRGSHFLFLGTMNCKVGEKTKWILGGVSLLLESE